MLPTREKHCCCPCVSNGSQKCNNSIWMRSVSKMKANLEKMEFRLESRDDTSSTLCWGFLLQNSPPCFQCSPGARSTPGNLQGCLGLVC